MKNLLKQHRILICAGTGGVGKTSIAAGLGVLAANSGLRTLVLTIDPARRLAQALGLDSHPGEETAVPGIKNLTATMIDPRREFDQFVLGSVESSVAKALFNNRLYQQLISNLSGSQEFTSLLKLTVAADSGRYDLVILDTPPTQNAIEFLQAPERLYALFQDSVLGWFSQVDKNEGFIQRTLQRGTKLVTSALEAVTGSTFIVELKDFFTHIMYLQKQVAQISSSVQTLLRDSKTGFLLVTGFDETKLKEALEFQQDLERENFQLRGVIVNRWFPEWTQGEESWPQTWDKDPDFQALKGFYAHLNRFFKSRQETYAEFINKVGGAVPVIKLPDFKNTVQGIEDLKLIAATLEEKWGEKK